MKITPLYSFRFVESGIVLHSPAKEMAIPWEALLPLFLNEGVQDELRITAAQQDLILSEAWFKFRRANDREVKENGSSGRRIPRRSQVQ